MRAKSKANGRQSWRRNPLHALKVAKGWTSAEMAKRCGYASRDGYEKVIRYTTIPDIKRGQRIAQLLGWTPGQVHDHWLVHYVGSRR